LIDPLIVIKKFLQLLQEKLGDAPTRAEDSRPDRNGQHSLDDNHQRPLTSDVQAARNNMADGH